MNVYFLNELNLHEEITRFYLVYEKTHNTVKNKRVHLFDSVPSTPTLTIIKIKSYNFLGISDKLRNP